MLSINNWQLLTADEKKRCLSRAESSQVKRQNIINLIDRIKTQGDKALLELTAQYDGARLTTIQIPAEKIQAATIDAQSENAIKTAIETITSYHLSMLPETGFISTAPGISIRTVYRPINSVGLYVPGGNKTPLVSSLLMQAIPAKVAGCPIKVLCTPPDSSGQINPNLLVAARLCGIETIYTLGGAQAIAAMAYGTETVTKVDKLFGPGNSYVTEAKTLVACDPSGAAIDMPAGPSEVMVVADNQANPAFIAADLLAQAEHGEDSQVLLLCDDLNIAYQVNQELSNQLKQLSRQNIVIQALKQSAIIYCPDPDEQINIINTYAPEHLIINRKDNELWIDQIKSAGTVFVGEWAAETMGDYVTGSNHVLPTNGYARNHSGLSTLDFMTRFNVQTVLAQGIKHLGSAAIKLAEIEGLDAHAYAVKVRLNALEV